MTSLLNSKSKEIKKAKEVAKKLGDRNKAILSIPKLPYPIIGWTDFNNKINFGEKSNLSLKKTKDRYLIKIVVK
jgi:hypothetical protein